ncbi:MAG: hypothetical protein IPL71_22835 [Anaerolineales bacterium]|nr:hypothetical protein [Anaerolineales bacterium]
MDGNDNVYMAGTSNATWGAPVRAYSAANDAFAVQLDSSGGPHRIPSSAAARLMMAIPSQSMAVEMFMWLAIVAPPGALPCKRIARAVTPSLQCSRPPTP